MCLALRKCKNDRKNLKIILVPDFCPLKPEIARFSTEFRLKYCLWPLTLRTLLTVLTKQYD